MTKLFKLFVLVVVAVSFAACSSTSTRRSFKEQWNDSMITSKVKWKLGRDDVVSAHNVDLNAWRGIVTMTGHVKTEDEKTRAEKVAMEVQGVTGVKNYIEVADEGVVVAPVVAAPAVVEKAVVPQPVAKAPAPKRKKIAKKKAPVKEVKEISEADLMEESVPGKRQNGVSYEIKKEFANNGVDTEMPPQDQIAKEAQEELKSLKSKKGN